MLGTFKICRPFIALALIALTGCKMEMTADIYTADIFATENLTFPVQLDVQVPTCKKEKIDELAPEVLAVFTDKSEASIAGCERSGMNSMLTVNLTGELTSKGSSYDVVVLRNSDDQYHWLNIAFNQNFTTRVEQMMSNKMMSIDYDDLTIRFNLNNDLSDTVEYFLASGWVDGQPGQSIRGSLERREKILVERSKVVSQMVMEDSQPELVTLFVESK